MMGIALMPLPRLGDERRRDTQPSSLLLLIRVLGGFNAPRPAHPSNFAQLPFVAINLPEGTNAGRDRTTGRCLNGPGTGAALLASPGERILRRAPERSEVSWLRANWCALLWVRLRRRRDLRCEEGIDVNRGALSQTARELARPFAYNLVIKNRRESLL